MEKNKIKILLISQYFWPENFKINDIIEGLSKRNYNVSVITGMPNYPKGNFFDNYNFFGPYLDNYKGINIYRSPLFPRKSGNGLFLLLNYLSFAFFASLRVLFIKEKFDKIFVYQPSPIFVGIPAIIASLKFKAKIYFWVQDLWPESIKAAGGIENKIFIKTINFVTKFIYKKCEKILVQSKGFINYIKNQNIDEKKIVYLPNTTEDFYKKLDPDQNILKTLPRGDKIIFAGNIGEAQSFDTIIKAAAILKEKNIKLNWIILGDGRMKNEMIQKIKKNHLSSYFNFLGSFESSMMPLFFSCSDMLLVTLKKNPIFSLTIPNKIQSYLACGKPIIASIDGEGGRIIKEAKAGFVSSAEDHHSLAKNIINFLKLSSEEKNELGNNALNYFDLEFKREKLFLRLDNLFNEA